MSEHQNDQDDRDVQIPTSVERRVIQEVIAAHNAARFKEQEEQEKLAQRQLRQKRAQSRRSESLDRARERKGMRLSAANEANARMLANVSEAARALRGALQNASSVSLPRYSDEGRNQQRTIRSLQAAMASLRGVGAGEFDSDNFEIDLDLDVE